jgi:hypothetical protein
MCSSVFAVLYHQLLIMLLTAVLFRLTVLTRGCCYSLFMWIAFWAVIDCWQSVNPQTYVRGSFDSCFQFALTESFCSSHAISYFGRALKWNAVILVSAVTIFLNTSKIIRIYKILGHLKTTSRLIFLRFDNCVSRFLNIEI